MRLGNPRRGNWLVGAAVVGLVVLCSAGTVSAQSATGAAAAAGEPPVRMEVLAEPHAVTGSDGNRHLVYELMLTNATDKTTYYVTEVTALDSGTGQPVAMFPTGSVQLLVDPPPAPKRNILHPHELGFLFVHIAVPAQAPVPSGLRHQVVINPTSINAPLTITGGETAVVQSPPVVLGPPLRGSRYIAGDGCCDAPRHVQAVMPDGHGGWWNAQRFAIDWEQLDGQNRLWVAQPGQAPRVEDYVIYGKDLLAVADGTVVGLADKVLPDQPPGRLPSDLPREEADGNHVILDLGNGVYVLYAHLAPNSVAVALNQRVSKGQVIGKVGNSGNTSAPHLHLQAMDRPSSLDANGLPYVFERFRIVGFDPLGSGDFQAAEDKGTPATIAEVSPPSEHTRQLPLNVVVVDWMN